MCDVGIFCQVEIAELGGDPDPACARAFVLAVVVGVAIFDTVGIGVAIAIAIGRRQGEEQVDVADGKVGGIETEFLDMFGEAEEGGHI